ncbi:hypothetical protein [Marivita sp. GX14005]|uniref:hypothetical protein n=1 Tax=Marivita sp. GX14005 TaxID=2942276 RepID=UPI002018ABD4|nr:hypothetical protein [Marivita sp. GX14005]MCL3882059.1 hypothetical protein [Marivita sp. GX14005]
MIEMQTANFVDYDSSAALGKTVPVENVPVGFMVLAFCPLILWLMDGTVAGFASALVVLALFAIGLICLSAGQRAHVAYDAAEIAARPRLPLKLMGSSIIALVVGLLATAKIGTPTVPMVIGSATFILCLVSFGLDPMRDKGMDNPLVRLRLANEDLYRAFETRFDRLLANLSTLGDDDLFERTRLAVDTVMGLVGTIDLESRTLMRIAPTLSKLIRKMEAEVDAMIDAQPRGLTGFERRKFHIKMQTLSDAFEARARRSGIAEGRNNFELQADLLFNRMQRNRTV